MTIFSDFICPHSVFVGPTPRPVRFLSSVCYEISDVFLLATFSTRGCGRTFHHIKEGLSDLTLAADVALYHCAALAVRGASQDSCLKSLQGCLLDLQDGMGRIWKNGEGSQLEDAGNPKCLKTPQKPFFFKDGFEGLQNS